MADASKDNSIKLEDVDAESFEYIVKYLELHKEKEPAKITLPIRSNQSVTHIIEEADGELVENIMEKGDELLLKMMDATLALDI